MKILILAADVGVTTPGLVFESLISGLNKYHEIDVYTTNCKIRDSSKNFNNVYLVPYKLIPEYRQSQLILLFGVNPYDLLWMQKIKKLLKSKKSKYDLILSLISNGHYVSLVCGVKISRKLNIKLAVYSVDALPAPLGWSNNDIYYRKLKIFINKFLSKTNIFFSANELMLNYQKSIINKNDIIYDVVFNPAYTNELKFVKQKRNIFLYTGEIYKVRKVKYIFNAFKMLLHEYPDAELHFVGTTINREEFSIFDNNERNSIKIFPKVNDLSTHYESAICLIDIDADLINDVYLSSKIINYLMINRPILCETGYNSPSRKLFNGISSIMHCNHDSEEIFHTMKKIIQCPIEDFSDRKNVIENFKLENIINKMNLTLDRIK